MVNPCPEWTAISRNLQRPYDFTDVTLVSEDDQYFPAHQVILATVSTMDHTSYGELRQLFETFTRVWGSGGQASLQLHTQDGKSRATLNIELGPPADPRPGAPVVGGERLGPNHGPQHHGQPRQQRPRRRGPAARARDVARRTAWLQGKEQQAEAEPNSSDIDTEIFGDTETVSASRSELVERSEAETSDSDKSDVIPQLDGPAEETLGLTPEKAAMEEDSVTEEEVDLAHLPTADDPLSFDFYIKSLTQEKIENMSKEEIIHMNAELAQKIAFKNTTEKKKKQSKSKKIKK